MDSEPDRTRPVLPDAPGQVRLTRAQLADLVRLDPGWGTLTVGDLLDAAPLVTLSARAPWSPAAHLDVYRPGRWDTSADQVYLDTIVQGAAPGMWDGSVGYFEFTPPASGTYLAIAHITGYQTTAHLRGPWGEVTGYTAAVGDPGAVVGVYTGGDACYFELTFTAPDNGYSLGYLQSLEIRAV